MLLLPLHIWGPLPDTKLWPKSKANQFFMSFGNTHPPYSYDSIPDITPLLGYAGRWTFFLIQNHRSRSFGDIGQAYFRHRDLGDAFGTSREFLFCHETALSSHAHHATTSRGLYKASMDLASNLVKWLEFISVFHVVGLRISQINSLSVSRSACRTSCWHVQEWVPLFHLSRGGNFRWRCFWGTLLFALGNFGALKFWWLQYLVWAWIPNFLSSEVLKSFFLFFDLSISFTWSNEYPVLSQYFESRAGKLIWSMVRRPATIWHAGEEPCWSPLQAGYGTPAITWTFNPEVKAALNHEYGRTFHTFFG